jgi:hypothetical protein
MFQNSRTINRALYVLAVLMSLATQTMATRPMGNQVSAETWAEVKLEPQRVESVAPWTGIVLWSDHEEVQTDAISLEYSYFGYDQCYQGDSLDFSKLDALLDDIASRKHQAVLRFYFVYPGRSSTVPSFIKSRADYKGKRAKSEGEMTEFVDWSCPAIESFMLDFYTKFAERYDHDPRLAYLQTGFGLWAEYHIYDGPWKLGETFPTKQFQKRFLNHLAETFQHTPWMISVDASDESYTPIAQDKSLLGLSFGVFDDSFLCKQHRKENEPDWNALDRNRWKVAPTGGEFSYYNKRDQKLALAPNGPNGESFEAAAKRFNLSFIIGSDQPEFQSMQRIAEAGQAIGYRMQIRKRTSNGTQTHVTVVNSGIAPMYHDAFITIADECAKETLRGLLPGQEKTFTIDQGQGSLSITSDRLVPGMKIPFETAQ